MPAVWPNCYPPSPVDQPLIYIVLIAGYIVKINAYFHAVPYCHDVNKALLVIADGFCFSTFVSNLGMTSVASVYSLVTNDLPQ